MNKVLLFIDWPRLCIIMLIFLNKPLLISMYYYCFKIGLLCHYNCRNHLKPWPVTWLLGMYLLKVAPRKNYQIKFLRMDLFALIFRSQKSKKLEWKLTGRRHWRELQPGSVCSRQSNLSFFFFILCIANPILNFCVNVGYHSHSYKR